CHPRLFLSCYPYSRDLHSFPTRRSSDLRRISFGATMGTDNMVLPTAISNSAVKVSLVMICLSSSTLAKIIIINALVCSSQPIIRSEEHTSELQSRENLVCRLLLEQHTTR